MAAAVLALRVTGAAARARPGSRSAPLVDLSPYLDLTTTGRLRDGSILTATFLPTTRDGAIATAKLVQDKAQFDRIRIHRSLLERPDGTCSSPAPTAAGWWHWCGSARGAPRGGAPASRCRFQNDAPLHRHQYGAGVVWDVRGKNADGDDVTAWRFLLAPAGGRDPVPRAHRHDRGHHDALAAFRRVHRPAVQLER